MNIIETEDYGSISLSKLLQLPNIANNIQNKTYYRIGDFLIANIRYTAGVLKGFRDLGSYLRVLVAGYITNSTYKKDDVRRIDRHTQHYRYNNLTIDELAQLCMEKLLRQEPRIITAGYLRSIVSSVCIDEYRKASTRLHVISNDFELEEVEEGNQQIFLEFRELLRALTKQEARVLTLSAAGADVNEIAEDMGLSRRKVFYLKKSLREAAERFLMVSCES